MAHLVIINSSWVVSPGVADLRLQKSGPSYAMAGSEILYNLVFSNTLERSQPQASL